MRGSMSHRKGELWLSGNWAMGRVVNIRKLPQAACVLARAAAQRFIYRHRVHACVGLFRERGGEGRSRPANFVAAVVCRAFRGGCGARLFCEQASGGAGVEARGRCCGGLVRVASVVLAISFAMPSMDALQALSSIACACALGWLYLQWGRCSTRASAVARRSAACSRRTSRARRSRRLGISTPVRLNGL